MRRNTLTTMSTKPRERYEAEIKIRRKCKIRRRIEIKTNERKII